MTRRYYVPELPSAGGLLELDEAEAHHALRVMRLSAGDPLTLFDGEGRESTAVVVETGRNLCLCRAMAPAVVDRESSLRLTLGIALPKPERAKEMVERLTEIGVGRMVPLVTERMQRPPSAALLEKLRRVVIEASKQCGRNRLMEIAATVGLVDYLREPLPTCRRILHPSAGACESDDLDGGGPQGGPPRAIDATLVAADRDPPSRADAVVLVGPEGGWSEAEVELAGSQGFRPLSLGRRIYRIETAAVVIASRWLD